MNTPLLLAAVLTLSSLATGQVDRSEINAKIQHAITAGDKAALRQHLEVLKSAGHGIWGASRDELTLIKASRSGDYEMVSMLLEYGLDIETYTRDEETALMVALANKDSGLIAFLLDHKAAVTWQTMLGPIENLSYDLIKLLAPHYGGMDGSLVRFFRHEESKADAPARTESTLEMARFLTTHGADVNHDLNGYTPLTTLASLYGIDMDMRLKLVAFLIDNGADVNLAKSDLGTPLLIAVGRSDPNGSGRNYDLARLLLDKGASQFVVTGRNYAPPIAIALVTLNLRIAWMLSWKFFVAYVLVLLTLCCYWSFDEDDKKLSWIPRYKRLAVRTAALNAKLFGILTTVGSVVILIIICLWLLGTY